MLDAPALPEPIASVDAGNRSPAPAARMSEKLLRFMEKRRLLELRALVAPVWQTSHALSRCGERAKIETSSRPMESLGVFTDLQRLFETHDC
jgi:hypothetical protein